MLQTNHLLILVIAVIAKIDKNIHIGFTITVRPRLPDLIDFAPVIAETAGFIVGEGDDCTVFGRCEVVGLHHGFLLAFLLGIELSKGREGLEVGGFYAHKGSVPLCSIKNEE